MKSLAIFFLLLCSTCAAQITLDVRPCRAITELSEPIAFGTTTVHFGETEKIVPAAIITTTSQYKFMLVKAYRSTGGRAPLLKLDDTHWLLAGEGKYDIEATGFDPGMEEATATVTLGPAPPDPDVPPPAPDVPEDGFDNLGQRVAVWSAGIAGREKVGEAYRDVSRLLRNDPAQTINSAAAVLSTRLLLIPEYVNFKAVTPKINADGAARTFSRGTYADWLGCIAIGMGVKL